jgi:hypothetical protein
VETTTVDVVRVCVMRVRVRQLLRVCTKPLSYTTAADRMCLQSKRPHLFSRCLSHGSDTSCPKPECPDARSSAPTFEVMAAVRSGARATVVRSPRAAAADSAVGRCRCCGVVIVVCAPRACMGLVRLYVVCPYARHFYGDARACLGRACLAADRVTVACAHVRPVVATALGRSHAVGAAESWGAGASPATAHWVAAGPPKKVCSSPSRETTGHQTHPPRPYPPPGRTRSRSCHHRACFCGPGGRQLCQHRRSAANCY